ncbi:MAG: glycosyltransferase family 4 protein [Nitrospiraceae bacterium]
MAGLDRSRWLPLLVVPEEGRVAEEARKAGLHSEVVPMPSPYRAGNRLITSVNRLRAVIADRGVDLVHANGSRAMVYAGLAARLAGRPAIWHVRVADSDGWLDRVLYRMASHIVVNSDAVQGRFAWASGRNVSRVHNGIDTERFTPMPEPEGLRASMGLTETDRIIVSVGRFVAYKGYGKLLEAAALLHRRDPSIHWLLIGDGELRQELTVRRDELGLAKVVHVTGWVEDVRPLLSLADVFVLPSFGEHFGRVVVEAMAMGKPVVATNAGGVPEIVSDGETGVLVASADADAMAQAVQSFLVLPERARQYGQAGRRRAVERFSLQRHVSRIESLYTELSGVYCAAV